RESNDAVTDGGGKYVAVNLDVLVERIYVSPLSADWVEGVVSREVKAHGLAQDVVGACQRL
ncbi:MAG: hypothetical protein ABI995_16305, partial [Acidobacteriota bacterium]